MRIQTLKHNLLPSDLQTALDNGFVDLVIPKALEKGLYHSVRDLCDESLTVPEAKAKYDMVRGDLLCLSDGTIWTPYYGHFKDVTTLVHPHPFGSTTTRPTAATPLTAAIAVGEGVGVSGGTLGDAAGLGSPVAGSKSKDGTVRLYLFDKDTTLGSAVFDNHGRKRDRVICRALLTQAFTLIEVTGDLGEIAEKYGSDSKDDLPASFPRAIEPGDLAVLPSGEVRILSVDGGWRGPKVVGVAEAVKGVEPNLEADADADPAKHDSLAKVASDLAAHGYYDEGEAGSGWSRAAFQSLLTTTIDGALTAQNVERTPIHARRVVRALVRIATRIGRTGGIDLHHLRREVRTALYSENETLEAEIQEKVKCALASCKSAWTK